MTAVHEALEQLRVALSDQPEHVPEGWLTADEWATQSNRPGSTVRRWLVEGQRKGLVEVRKFRVLAGIAGIRPVPHYRIKEQAS